jgi:hypothetical protein
MLLLFLMLGFKLFFLEFFEYFNLLLALGHGVDKWVQYILVLLETILLNLCQLYRSIHNPRSRRFFP